MKKIIIPTAKQILMFNKLVCEDAGNQHHCFDIGKVESAIHSAFYPGSNPFVHGGVVKIAGALCYYLVQAHAFVDGNKRTGALAATTFLRLNGYKIVYPINKDNNEFANIIEKCASSKISKEELMDWFETHSHIIRLTRV